MPPAPVRFRQRSRYAFIWCEQTQTPPSRHHLHRHRLRQISRFADIELQGTGGVADSPVNPSYQCKETHKFLTLWVRFSQVMRLSTSIERYRVRFDVTLSWSFPEKPARIQRAFWWKQIGGSQLPDLSGEEACGQICLEEGTSARAAENSSFCYAVQSVMTRGRRRAKGRS